MRKIIPVIAVISLLLTGCMSAGDTVSPTPEATMNNATVIPAETQGIELGAFDWNTRAQEVEAAVSNLSEVKEARVAIAGNTALVAVKFDDAYKGGGTERVREMIAGVVKNADKSIETVAVTSEENDVKSVYDISDKVRAGQKFEEFKDDINSIVRNATTLR